MPQIYADDAEDLMRAQDYVHAQDPVTDPRARALPLALEKVSAAINAMPTMLGNGAPGLGSNSWVVAGSRTDTGKPLLANDPHLAPAMPSLWGQAKLWARGDTIPMRSAPDTIRREARHALTLTP